MEDCFQILTGRRDKRKIFIFVCMSTRWKCILSSLVYKISIRIIVLLFLFGGCNSSKDNFIYPDREYPELFKDVQRNKVFSDDKTFPDCVPQNASYIINFRYWVWKKRHPVYELKEFVKANFEFPTSYIDSVHIQNSIFEHIKDVSDALLIKKERQPDRSSLIPLPNDFVIPGGRFRETYYWDTYFTLLGYADLDQKNIVYNVTENMAYLINKFGYVPNGNRSYYLSRSQPPFFSLIVEMNAKLFADTMYVHFLPEMLREYQFWMSNPNKINNYRNCVILKDSVVLNRYFDDLSTPRIEMYNEDINTFNKHRNQIEDTLNFYRNLRSTAESGWDFSSRWLKNDTDIFSIETLDILPVDLNCLLYHLEETISKAYQLQHDTKSDIYAKLAGRRKENIENTFWNDSAGFYFDYNYTEKMSTMKFTLAGVFPLFMGIADSSEALKVTNNIRKYFLKPGRVVTTMTNSGQQWDSPNGWAPLEWMSIRSLKKYHYFGLADTIKNRWIHVNEGYYNRTQKMLEKYNVVDT